MAHELGYPELAAQLRDASATWRAARQDGTATEAMRPRVVFPRSVEWGVSDLLMAIADEMAFLDDRGYAVMRLFSDYTEDRIVWVNESGATIEVGVSSGPIVMLGHVDDGDQLGRHAAELVPPDVAARLPSMELASGETDVSTTLPSCRAWAMAALDMLE